MKTFNDTIDPQIGYVIVLVIIHPLPRVSRKKTILNEVFPFIFRVLLLFLGYYFT